MRVKYNDKTIGELEQKDDEVVFTKQVDPRKHKMHAFNAYAIQESAFQEHLQDKNGKVIIKEIDSKGKESRTLEATIWSWEKQGFTRDMGAGEQRFLMINKMKGEKVDNKFNKKLKL